MVRTPGWVAVAASASLFSLSVLVLHLDGVALTGPLVLVVAAGSAGLVALLGSLHPYPAVALADRRPHVALAVVPFVILLIAVHLPGAVSLSPTDPVTLLLLLWAVAGGALYASAGHAQARHYERHSEQVVHLRVRPTAPTRRRHAAAFGVVGVVLVAVGLGLVVRVSSASSSLVMGLGFSALFSGVVGMRRPRTYRLVEAGLVRQDSGAAVSYFVHRSRIEVAERDGGELRLERRGPWYPATTFTVEETGGDREAATRWFTGRGTNGASRSYGR